MSQKTEDEILKKVGDVQKGVDDVKTLVSPSNVATKAELTTNTNKIMKAIKEGPETSKNIFESLFEALGLKDLFAAFKDGGDPFSKILLAIGALAALVLGKLFDFGKMFNAAYEKISRSRANRNLPDGERQRPGRVIAIGESGRPQRMTRAQMDGLNAVSINPHGLTSQRLNGLKSALNGLPEKIRDFNSATADMKSPGTINKIAKAIGELKKKLTPNPKKKIEDTAKAIGELHTKLEPFDPQKLPKARTLRDVAKAAQDLNRNAGTLRNTFLELSREAGNAAGAIGAGA